MVSPEMTAVAAMAFVSGSLIGATVVMLVLTRGTPDERRELDKYGENHGLHRIPGEANRAYRKRLAYVTLARAGAGHS